MTNKNFWLGILVMVLVFGMTVVGCDDGSGNDGGGNGNPFVGTWVGTDRDGDRVTLVCTATNWTATFIGGTETGTYTYSGNTVTIKQGTVTLGTAILSGSTLIVTGSNIPYAPWTLTKQGTSGNGNNIPVSLIGTYGYAPTGILTITFKNNGTFTGNQSSGDVNGTYTVSGNNITLSQRYFEYNWTIIDSTTVRDESGDNWRKR